MPLDHDDFSDAGDRPGLPTNGRYVRWQMEQLMREFSDYKIDTNKRIKELEDKIDRLTLAIVTGLISLTVAIAVFALTNGGGGG
jgi:phosphate uptake regulator